MMTVASDGKKKEQRRFRSPLRNCCDAAVVAREHPGGRRPCALAQVCVCGSAYTCASRADWADGGQSDGQGASLLRSVHRPSGFLGRRSHILLQTTQTRRPLSRVLGMHGLFRSAVVSGQSSQISAKGKLSNRKRQALCGARLKKWLVWQASLPCTSRKKPGRDDFFACPGSSNRRRDASLRRRSSSRPCGCASVRRAGEEKAQARSGEACRSKQESLADSSLAGARAGKRRRRSAVVRYGDMRAPVLAFSQGRGKDLSSQKCQKMGTGNPGKAPLAGCTVKQHRDCWGAATAHGFR